MTPKTQAQVPAPQGRIKAKKRALCYTFLSSRHGRHPLVHWNHSLRTPVPRNMLSPVSNHQVMHPNGAPLPDRSQEKGPKFDAFFSTVMRGANCRSRAVARNRDQKR
jgi:hypothetical protein